MLFPKSISSRSILDDYKEWLVPVLFVMFFYISIDTYICSLNVACLSGAFKSLLWILFSKPFTIAAALLSSIYPDGQ